MKLLINAPSFEIRGGVGSLYQELSPSFPNTVQFFTVGSRTPKAGFVHRLAELLTDYRHFWSLLRKSEYDVVLLNPSLMPKAALRDAVFHCFARMAGKRTVLFFHGWDLGLEKTIRKRYLRWFRRAFFSADAIIVLASQFETSLREMGYEGTIHLGTTAANDALFSLSNKDPRRDGRLPFQILFMSRVEEAKGIFVVLEAYRILRERHRGITLKIAGDGSALQAAMEYAQRNSLDDVEFCGFVSGEKKLSLLEESACFLLPSYSEGMPCAVVEAMAAGLPVVTRTVGGIRDFFQHAEMGFLTDSLDPDVVADLVEKLIVSPDACQKMRQHNRKYSATHFAASKVAARLLEVCESVMDECS
jgi:glycosyltransferase involved in cell wall biosynthesis